jgi:hypothetical protein
MRALERKEKIKRKEKEKKVASDFHRFTSGFELGPCGTIEPPDITFGVHG